VCVHGIIIWYQKGNDHIGIGYIAVKLFGAGSPTDWAQVVGLGGPDRGVTHIGWQAEINGTYRLVH